MFSCRSVLVLLLALLLPLQGVAALQAPACGNVPAMPDSAGGHLANHHAGLPHTDAPHADRQQATGPHANGHHAATGHPRADDHHAHTAPATQPADDTTAGTHACPACAMTCCHAPGLPPQMPYAPAATQPASPPAVAQVTPPPALPRSGPERPPRPVSA